MTEDEAQRTGFNTGLHPNTRIGLNYKYTMVHVDVVRSNAHENKLKLPESAPYEPMNTSHASIFANTTLTDSMRWSKDGRPVAFRSWG